MFSYVHSALKHGADVPRCGAANPAHSLYSVSEAFGLKLMCLQLCRCCGVHRDEAFLRSWQPATYQTQLFLSRTPRAHSYDSGLISPEASSPASPPCSSGAARSARELEHYRTLRTRCPSALLPTSWDMRWCRSKGALILLSVNSGMFRLFPFYSAAVSPPPVSFYSIPVLLVPVF